jgi:predicted GNAT family acetyltransferase
MAASDDIPQPENREAEHRFVLTIEGHEAELVYERTPERLVLVHTEVPDELEGRGIGGVLVRTALEVAARENLVVVPRCQFARRWLKRHPEVAELVEIEWPSLGARSHP